MRASKHFLITTDDDWNTFAGYWEDMTGDKLKKEPKSFFHRGAPYEHRFEYDLANPADVNLMTMLALTFGEFLVENEPGGVFVDDHGNEYITVEGHEAVAMPVDEYEKMLEEAAKELPPMPTPDAANAVLEGQNG